MTANLTALIAAASTAQLVAAYNAASAKSVTKFQDRATAERRVLVVLQGLVSAGRFCPHCAKSVTDIDLGNITAAGPEGTAAAERHLCHSCDTEFRADGSVFKRPAASSAAAGRIAESWQREDVRRARTTRHAVRVTSAEGLTATYRSVREAFVNLHLPLGQHIKFRMKLKAAGAAMFDDLTFVVADA